MWRFNTKFLWHLTLCCRNLLYFSEVDKWSTKEEYWKTESKIEFSQLTISDMLLIAGLLINSESYRKLMKFSESCQRQISMNSFLYLSVPVQQSILVCLSFILRMSIHS